MAIKPTTWWGCTTLRYEVGLQRARTPKLTKRQPLDERIHYNLIKCVKECSESREEWFPQILPCCLIPVNVVEGICTQYSLDVYVCCRVDRVFGLFVHRFVYLL